MPIDKTVRKGTVPYRPPREDLMGIAGTDQFLGALYGVVPAGAVKLDGVIPRMAVTGLEDGLDVGASVLDKKEKGLRAPHGERTTR